MSNGVLILGNSGTGKSTSIRNLPHENTFIINVGNKNLPFKSANKKYTKMSQDGLTGNHYSSDNPMQIIRLLNLINEKRPEIKYLIIDDFGFVLMNEFIKTALIKGFDKFSTMAQSFANIINIVNDFREDLFLFVMMHVEVDSHGITKPRTIGKMIDQYVIPEAKFTYVFHTFVHDGNYKFITNNDNYHMCKTPLGLFAEQHIDNDLLLIANKITEYLNEDIDM